MSNIKNIRLGDDILLYCQMVKLCMYLPYNTYGNVDDSKCYRKSGVKEILKKHYSVEVVPEGYKLYLGGDKGYST